MHLKISDVVSKLEEISKEKGDLYVVGEREYITDIEVAKDCFHPETDEKVEMVILK